ncbi:MAG: M20 family peptidase, partial [Oxalobacteraceae bacterium]
MDPKSLVDRIDEKACLDFLSKMVQHKSHSETEGEKVLARWMAAELDKIGVEAELQAFDDGRRFNTIGRLKGQGGGKSLLFNGHLDTNPVTEGW